MTDARIGRYVVRTRLGPVTLATDEELVSITASPFVLPTHKEPPLSVLLRMASADSEAGLGAYGPVIASLANKENSTNPDLRRYEAVYGRDALYTAAFLRGLYPALEEGTIRFFAAYQADHSDPLSLAAPGKIAHHIRDPSDPVARRLTAETGRRWPWYGGTDTTVLFLIACAHAAARNPELLCEQVTYPPGHPQGGTRVYRGGAPLTIRDVIREAALWLRRELGRPPQPGLLWCWLNLKDSYTVWTDSPNSFYFGNGVIPPPPVAPIQLQAEVYDAATGVAALAAADPALHLDADVFTGLAVRVRSLVLDHAVVGHPLGPYLAAGLVTGRGHQPQPLDIRTVGMGMTLDSDLLACPEAAGLRESVLAHLTSPEMTSPFGLVGRARDEVRFTPFDYHSQVWAFATHRTALGLRRYGYTAQADALSAAILEQTRDGLLPENVGADADHELRYCQHVLTVRRPAPDGRMTVTVKERPPAPYAAWTAGAVIATLAGTLGRRAAAGVELA
jgi:glycogen debranching enzyme